jgi:hypothetical protein
VKQFIVKPLVLFCYYKILRLGAATESRRTGNSFYSVIVPSEGQLAFLVSKVKPLIKVLSRGLEVAKIPRQKT